MLVTIGAYRVDPAKMHLAGVTTPVAFVANLNLRRNNLDEKLGMVFFIAMVHVGKIFTCLFFKIKI